MTRLLETSIECLPDGVLVCDADGVLVTVNPAARRLLGEQFQPGRSLLAPGGPAFRACALTGEPVPSDELPLRRALRGEHVADLRLIVTADTGARRQVSVTAVPVVNGFARRYGATAVVREIPAERTPGLADAAHQVRTTLTSVRGAVRLLRRSLASPVPLACDDLLKLAERSTEALVLQMNTLFGTTRSR